MMVIRKSARGFEYRSRGHDNIDKTGRTQNDPHTGQPEDVFRCRDCGQTFVARLWGTQLGPKPCLEHWRPVSELDPSFQRAIDANNQESPPWRWADEASA